MTAAGCSPSSGDDGPADGNAAPGVDRSATVGTEPAGSDAPGGGTSPGLTGFHATEGPVPPQHARALVDGAFAFFDRVVGSCTINRSVIVFAHRSRSDGPDLVTGSSNDGWIQMRLSSTNSVGYRMRLDMADPGLELDPDEASFSLTGPATRHPDVDDLDDPGTPAGDMTVTVAC